MKHIIYVRKKPYYYYKTFNSWQAVQRFTAKHKKIHYFYVKTYNKKTGGTAYALYFDKQVL